MAALWLGESLFFCLLCQGTKGIAITAPVERGVIFWKGQRGRPFLVLEATAKECIKFGFFFFFKFSHES